MGIDPHAVRVVGNQISLAGQARDPEAVVRIRGEQLDEGRRRVIVIANRDVQFIRRHDPECWIAVFPPELMADGNDFDRVIESCLFLDACDHPRGRHEQSDDDENRNNRPRQFHLIAAVYLGRFASIVTPSLSEFHDGVKQQGKHDEKNDSCHREYKQRQSEDRSGGGRSGSEDIRRAKGGIDVCKSRRCAADTKENLRTQEAPFV